MATFLENLQKRSEKERLGIAVLVTLVVIGVLMAGWSYNLTHSGTYKNLANTAGDGIDRGQALSKELENAFARFQASMPFLDLMPTEATTTEEAIVATTTATSSLGARQIELFATPTTTLPIPGENPADVLY